MSKCPVCGKEYRSCFLLTPFFEIDKNTQNLRRVSRSVCSEECQRKNEERFVVEKYKGNNIYCVEGRYMPYLDCLYYYERIEGVKARIDNPHLVPMGF